MTDITEHVTAIVALANVPFLAIRRLWRDDRPTAVANLMV